jgi:parallel beta-helix repeat protein/predicted outer membrane repeat protein
MNPKPIRSLLRLFCGIALAHAFAAQASAATLTVVNTNDSGPGSLRQAIADAVAGDTVAFLPGLSGQTITLTTGQISLDRNVTITASGLSAGVTISGNSDGDDVLEQGESRIFEVPAGVVVTLRRLHLTNGIADPASDIDTGEGGAIRNSGQLTLDGCVVSLCQAKRGGGINSVGGLTAGRSSFQENTAAFGGAIHSAGNGLLTVSDSTFVLNSATTSGGAVLENDANSPPGHPTLTNCTFQGNMAIAGGAVFSFSLTNLSHCTLSGNTASSNGGGIFASFTSVVTLTNCLVAGNTSANSPDLGAGNGGVYSPAEFNLVGDFTGSGLSEGAMLLTGDPLLDSLGNYGGPTQTMPPLPGSPAIDPAGGAAASPFATDQRGFPRVTGGIVDLGAVEYLPTQHPALIAPSVVRAARNGRATIRGASVEATSVTYVVAGQPGVKTTEGPASNWVATVSKLNRPRTPVTFTATAIDGNLTTQVVNVRKVKKRNR